MEGSGLYPASGTPDQPEVPSLSNTDQNVAGAQASGATFDETASVASSATMQNTHSISPPSRSEMDQVGAIPMHLTPAPETIQETFSLHPYSLSQFATPPQRRIWTGYAKPEYALMEQAWEDLIVQYNTNLWNEHTGLWDNYEHRPLIMKALNRKMFRARAGSMDYPNNTSIAMFLKVPVDSLLRRFFVDVAAEREVRGAATWAQALNPVDTLREAIAKRLRKQQEADECPFCSNPGRIGCPSTRHVAEDRESFSERGWCFYHGHSTEEEDFSM